MKQDPSRGGGSTLSPAYSAALEALAKKRKENNEDKPWYEDVAGAIGGAFKYVYDNAPSSNPVSTPVNMGGGTVSMGGQGTGKSLVTEPARLAVRRAVGDVTAIPGVGEPSSSYTADQVRQQGVVRGVVGAALDYSQFLPVVAKGTRVAGDVVNASKLAAMERRANPFPALRGEMGNVIDVVEGSRLPATIVETPSNPYRTTRNALAEDMAQAQVPRPTVTPATMSPRLEVPTMAPTVPDMPPGFPLPEVPSNMTLLDFQRMPEYQAYVEAGRSIDPRAMAGFAFDPETAYLVHSGRGQLIGGKLDPHRTLSGLNDGHTRAVLRGRDRAIASADVLQDQLDTFVRTGVWNGDELAQRMPPGYSSEGGKVPLNGVVKASDMSEQQLQEFVNRIQTRINEHTDFYSSVEPFAALARREPFLSYYPAPVGGKSGYMGWHSGPEGGGMYLAAVPADRATTLFGPGIYEKRLGVPEWQAFGQQTPIAGITEFPNQWGSDNTQALTRAFAVQKTIEDRMRRGLYGRAEGRRLTPEVAAPQAERVAPGFITSEPVPVGNIGKLPSGVDVELATPEQSVAFVADQGSLDQVPTEHLWQTITENSGPGKRFEQIGGGGGATGMDRFRDTVTGQQMGLKHVPGEQDLVANGFIARTFFETLSDDVGSAMGIPRMGVRTVVNSDGSVSLVTELAQSVYDGEIMDSFQAMTRSPDGAPALGNRVTVNSRIRKALLDDLLENADVHDGNQLFVTNNDGTVDIIPIDLEHTFSSMQSVLNPQNLISQVFSVDDVRQISWGQFSDVDRNGVENWSLRNRIVQDTDNLRDEIQAVIETAQQQLSVDNLQREMKLRIDEIGRSYQRVAGANSANLDKFLKQGLQTVELFMTRIGDFLDTPAKDIANAYIKAIEAGVFA